MKNLKLIKIFLVVFCFLFQFNFLIFAVKGQDWDEYEACELRELQWRDRCIEKADQKKGDCVNDCYYPDNILDEATVACSHICYATWNVDFDRCYANMNECVMPDEDEEYNDNEKKGDTYSEDDNSGDTDYANNNLDNALIGLPLDSSINAAPCVGETPKNSKVCSGDEEEVFYYTQKELVEFCSVPKGSEPKCEYVCKGGYNLVDGECESAGFFAKILNWLGELF